MLSILAGGDLVLDWHLTHQIFFTFEASLTALERVCPPALAVVEVRPGVGLLSVGLVRMQGRGELTTPMDEVFTVIHVSPDLSLEMPNPKFSFFIYSVWSNSAAFVQADREHISAPVVHDPTLAISFDDAALSATASTSDGPIATLHYQDSARQWGGTTFVGQHFTDQAGLRLGAWQWQGQRAEHMRGGQGGVLHPHRFWRDVDPRGITRTYRQMVKQPGTVARERFFAMHLRDGV